MTEMKTKDEETTFRVQVELSGPQMATRTASERDSLLSPGDMTSFFLRFMCLCICHQGQKGRSQQEPGALAQDSKSH